MKMGMVLGQCPIRPRYPDLLVEKIVAREIFRRIVGIPFGIKGGTNMLLIEIL